MEIAGTVSSLLTQKESEVWFIEPDATVYEAIALMAEKNIGALPVLSAGQIVGIVTERDYTRKVVLKGKSSKETPVKAIMSGSPILAEPGENITDCMATMIERRVRHLPVVEGGKLLGIISMGDLVRWVIDAQAATIDQLERYMTGGAPA